MVAKNVPKIEYVPTICPYCGTGCGLNFVVKDGKIIGVEPWKRHPVNEGKVCPKGNFGYEFINREDRLKTPLIKENGRTFIDANYVSKIPDELFAKWKRIR